jgi:hypothetical protein
VPFCRFRFRQGGQALPLATQDYRSPSILGHIIEEMKPLLLLFPFLLSAAPAPQLSFVASTAGIDLRLSGGAAAAAIQVRFAVPAGTTITAGPALGTTKTLSTSITAGAASVLISGMNALPLQDGTLATIQLPASVAVWPFSAVDALAVDPQGQNVPGVTVAGLAFGAGLLQQRDAWKYGAPGYRLSYPVYGGEANALVFLNGLLQTQGADYQLVGTLLQFSLDLTKMDTPRISVIYWHQ